MQCTSCGSANPEGAKFCIECAAPLKKRCPGCGAENLPRAKFCAECAFPLTTQAQPVPSSRSSVASPQHPEPRTQSPASYTPPHLAERILATQAALEARGATDGERKTITALFADIKDSTALIEDLDPEAAQRIIDPALQLMMDAVHRYEGYVAQSLGDGIFALFGAPIAHEDHAQRALYAALRMQEESRRYAEQLRREQGLNLQIRVGVNTGDVVLRSIRKDDLQTDYLPVGHSTHIAARMESLASGGSIIISEHTYKITDGYFEFKVLGATKVKGLTEPIHSYEVLGVGQLRTRLQVAAWRGLSRFVGRQSEMEQLWRALEFAKGGHGQIVGVMGEPGVGKSRLFYEFKLLSQKGCVVLETFSVSHGKAYAYLPLIELLKNYFRITLQDDERTRREKVGGKVLMLDRSLEDSLPYLFFLLELAEPASPLQQMDPQIRKKRTLEAIKRLLVRESLNQPLIIIFEDLHWLDGETQAFLSLLSESVVTANILLLVNYRPEYRHEWGSKTYYTQLRLDPLGQEDARELLTVLLGDASTLQPFKQFILAKTAGNPFFMEEIVQSLFEQGVLVRGPVVGAKLRPGLSAGHSPLPGRASPIPTDLQLPTTVQGVLAARIDRLPPDEKALLQTLAVIGKEFPLSLVRQVVDKPEDELHRGLSHLQTAEFIYEQPAFPEVEYTFKHALTQEVAYNSVLIERRKLLHERTAQAIEALFPYRLEDHYNELAHHYSRSGNTEKAVEYLQRAGQQAVQRSAYTAAISHLTTALAILQTQPETLERAQRELLLLTTLGPALAFTKGVGAPEVEQTYTRARALCQQVREPSQLFPVLWWLCESHLQRGRLQTAYELAEQLLSLSQGVQDQGLVLEAHYVMGETSFWLGKLTSAHVHLEQTMALYDPQQHSSHAFLYGTDPGVQSGCFAAWTLWLLGYANRALQKVHESLSLAQEVTHPFSLAIALLATAVLYEFRREGQATHEWAEALMRLSTDQGFPEWLAWGTILRGWALAEQGQGEEGIAQMRQGLDAWRATGAEIARAHYLALLAETYGKGGQTQEGLSVLSEAFAVMEKNGERYCEAELYRLKGELSLQSRQVKASQNRSEVTNPHPLTPDPQSEAETCFLKAIEVARKQQAKSLELRAVMNLARVRQSQGKRKEAHEMLAEVYGWFTEGFDTKDLQEAKALLDELEQ